MSACVCGVCVRVCIVCACVYERVYECMCVVWCACVCMYVYECGCMSACVCGVCACVHVCM